MANALHRRGGQEVVARNVRKALEIAAIGEGSDAGRPALVTGEARKRRQIKL
jgi:hypothetical protein